MNAWFQPDAAHWLSFLSFFALLSLLTPLAQRGLYKTWVISADAGAILLGLCFLGAAGVATRADQPQYVTRPFLITGITLTIVCGAVLPVILRAYRDAERRRMAALDL